MSVKGLCQAARRRALPESVQRQVQKIPKAVERCWLVLALMPLRFPHLAGEHISSIGTHRPQPWPRSADRNDWSIDCQTQSWEASSWPMGCTDQEP